MKKYRQIWKDQYGNIPTDENGISYEIHHIDGNKHNNSISNLLCVSIRDHYDIHYKQGDWNACLLISERLILSEEDKIELNKKVSQIQKGKKERIVICPHCKKQGGISAMKRWHFENCNKINGRSKRNFVCPHCNKSGGGNMHQWHFNNCPSLTGIKRIAKKIVSCPYCDKVGDISNMKRYHFDHCKYKFSEL